MYNYIGQEGINKPWELAEIIFYMAVILGLALYKYEGKFFRIWFFIVVFNLLLKFFYFSVHIYYFYEAYYFAVVLVAVGFIKLAEKNKLLLFLIVLQTQVYIAIMCYYIVFDLNITFKRPESIYDYIAARANRCDYVFSANSNMNLFQKDLGYYWFLYGQLDVVGSKMGLHPIDNYNKLIEEKLPKFILAHDVYDRFEKMRGNEILVHDFDFEMINKYYDKKSSDFELAYDKEKGWHEKKVDGGLFELKKEYRKNNCQYDDKTGEWEYK